MIYGIFGGCYSDWYVVGYFEEKDDAEQYILQKGNGGYYIEDIEELDSLNTTVKALYHHVVVIDKTRGLREEPNKYTPYIGNKKKTSFCFSNFTNNNEWFSVSVTANKRKIAEKIAEDYYAEFLSLKSEYGRDNAITMMHDKIK